MPAAPCVQESASTSQSCSHRHRPLCSSQSLHPHLYLREDMSPWSRMMSRTCSAGMGKHEHLVRLRCDGPKGQAPAAATAAAGAPPGSSGPARRPAHPAASVPSPPAHSRTAACPHSACGSAGATCAPAGCVMERRPPAERSHGLAVAISRPGSPPQGPRPHHSRARLLIGVHRLLRPSLGRLSRLHGCREASLPARGLRCRAAGALPRWGPWEQSEARSGASRRV